MVKEVHCQLEKFAKYSLNKYSRLRVCKKYTNHQSQLKQLKQLQQMNFSTPWYLAIIRPTEQVNLK